MDKSEWSESSYQYELPVDGSGDGCFPGMGIEFGPISEGDQWRGANLPEGFVLVKSKNHWVILDSNSSVRANVYPNNNPHMRPNYRFRYGQDPYNTTNTKVRFCIWDKKVPYPEKEKVAMEMERDLPDKQNHSETYKVRLEIYQKEFEEKANKWLSEKYPNWGGYNEHWQDE